MASAEGAHGSAQRVSRISIGRVMPDAKFMSLLCVYFSVFVDMIGITLLLPVMPFLAGAEHHHQSFSREQLGMEPGQAIAVMTFAMVAPQFVSTMSFGPLSDRYGRKKLLLASLVGSVVGFFLQGLSITLHNYTLFIIARAFTGMFAGSRPVAISYIADVAAPDQRPKLLGFVAFSVTLALQFGPVLGGSLGLLSLSLPCYAAASVSFLGLVAVSFRVCEPPKSEHIAGGSDSRASDAAKRKTFVLDCCASLLLGFSMMLTTIGLPILCADKFHLNSNEVGLTSFGDGVMVLIGTPCYIILIKYMAVPAVAACGCLMLSMIAALPYLDFVPMLIVRYLAIMGGPLVMPAITAIVTLLAPPKLRGMWSGIAIALQSLGRVLAPIVFGFTYDFHYQLPFITAGVAPMIAMVLCLTMVPRVPKLVAPKETKKGSQSAKQLDEDLESEVMSAKESDPDVLSQHACAVVESLRANANIVRRRVEKMAADSENLEPTPTADPQIRGSAAAALGEWLADLLENNGYIQWADHLPAIKTCLLNTFPPLRQDNDLVRLGDLIDVLEDHIGMAERSRVTRDYDCLESLQVVAV